MSVIDLASRRSLWRGIDYYQSKRVNLLNKSNTYCNSIVNGSGNNVYNVYIDFQHPRKSTCTCPFANGHRICKHMVATYFALFPNEAKQIIFQAEEYENEQERLAQEEYNEKYDYVYSLSKDELRQVLLNYLLDDEDDYNHISADLF